MNIAFKERLSRGTSIVDDLNNIAPSYDAIETSPPVSIFCPVHETRRTQSECERVGSCLDAPKRHVANLAKLEAELNRNPLDEIAKLVRALTYGEMMDLAEAIWRTKPESDITQDALPMMLHKWSGSRT